MIKVHPRSELQLGFPRHARLGQAGQFLYRICQKKRREGSNQAALVVLGGPRDFPSLRVSNLLVAPGRETWVEVKPSDDNGCADDGDGPVVFMWRPLAEIFQWIFRYIRIFHGFSIPGDSIGSNQPPLFVLSVSNFSWVSFASRE